MEKSGAGMPSFRVTGTAGLAAGAWVTEGGEVAEGWVVDAAATVGGAVVTGGAVKGGIAGCMLQPEQNKVIVSNDMSSETICSMYFFIWTVPPDVS